MFSQTEIKQRLPEIFAAFPEARAVYLFGSYARGKANEHSDLDLAVFLKTGTARRIKLDLLTVLAGQGFCDVDLVLLNDASPLLRFEAVKYNRLIYRAVGFDAAGFYSRIIREYLDIEPFLNLHLAKHQARMRQFRVDYQQEAGKDG
jgi:predicted nucleotidyltransferase